MEAPLTLRSAAGARQRLHAELPVGQRAARRAEPLPRRQGPVGITLDGRLVVMVEDEPAVREGLEVLLRGWGASVVAFDSVAGRGRGRRRADAGADAPALLIVDYRLEQGHTGIEALVALRGRFGARAAGHRGHRQHDVAATRTRRRSTTSTC